MVLRSTEVSDLIQSLGDRMPSERGLEDAVPLTPSPPVPVRETKRTFDVPLILLILFSRLAANLDLGHKRTPVLSLT